MLDEQGQKPRDRAGIDLWSAIVIEQAKPKFESVVSAADTLTVNEKAKLIKHLLGTAPLSVVVGGNQQISGSIAVQINTASNEVLGDILDAVAERVRKGQ